MFHIIDSQISVWFAHHHTCIYLPSEISESQIESRDLGLLTPQHAALTPRLGLGQHIYGQPAHTHHRRRAASRHFGLNKPQSTWDFKFNCRRSYRRTQLIWGREGEKLSGRQIDVFSTCLLGRRIRKIKKIRARPTPCPEHMAGPRPVPVTLDWAYPPWSLFLSSWVGKSRS